MLTYVVGILLLCVYKPMKLLTIHYHWAKSGSTATFVPLVGSTNLWDDKLRFTHFCRAVYDGGHMSLLASVYTKKIQVTSGIHGYHEKVLCN